MKWKLIMEYICRVNIYLCNTKLDLSHDHSGRKLVNLITAFSSCQYNVILHPHFITKATAKNVQRHKLISKFTEHHTKPLP